jgi:uncharacterized Rmd1/YagE family protein
MAEASGPAVTLAASLGMQRPIAVRALLLGERLATNRFEQQEALARTPLTLSVREGGLAILFRYGVIVLMNVGHDAEIALLDRLAPVVSDPFEPRESDEARVDVRADSDDQVDVNGMIVVKEVTLERLQLVADVLAKGLVLSHYETRIAIGFDRIEPMADTLRRRGRIGIAVTPLLRQIGNALLVQHKMVGRVETGEKPELLWDNAELERFYARLAEEYELRERSRALDHKQDVILRTSEILLGLVQERGNTRLEMVRAHLDPRRARGRDLLDRPLSAAPAAPPYRRRAFTARQICARASGRRIASAITSPTIRKGLGTSISLNLFCGDVDRVHRTINLARFPQQHLRLLPELEIPAWARQQSCSRFAGRLRQARRAKFPHFLKAPARIQQIASIFFHGAISAGARPEHIDLYHPPLQILEFPRLGTEVPFA